MRQHPRFITQQEILLDVDGRNDLRPVWMSDISKGGLFVQGADRPALRSPVQIIIQSPEGQLVLAGEVVHVVEGEFGGVGVQFTDLTPERRALIEAYVEGLAESLDEEQASHDLTSNETQQVHEALTTFLKGVEQENLYAGLGIDPSSPPEDVLARLKELKQLFDTKPSKLPPALGARLEHSRAVLSRVRVLMTDPTRRRDYDFRHGHIFPERRIVAARTPPAVAELQQAWQRLYPERVHESRRTTADAIRSVNKLNYEAAVAKGELALIDDPFNLELREALREWKNRLSRRNAPMPAPRKRTG